MYDYINFPNNNISKIVIILIIIMIIETMVTKKILMMIIKINKNKITTTIIKIYNDYIYIYK